MADFFSTPEEDSDDMAQGQRAVRMIIGGVVQGVGFRWFVKRVADDYSVAGFVRNLRDGTVEAVAEGDSSSVHGFVDEVRIGPSSAHVTGVKIEWMEYEGKYRDFDIQL